MVYSLNVWGLFGYVKKKDTPVSEKSDSVTISDNSVRETVQDEATTSASSTNDGAVFSFKLDGPETFDSVSSETANEPQNAQPQVPLNTDQETVSQEEAAMATSSEENDLKLELDEKFDGTGFVSSAVKTMPKFNTARRSSKRFVIGDGLEEDAASPETEVLLTVPNPEWLKASSKLKPGTTLT